MNKGRNKETKWSDKSLYFRGLEREMERLIERDGGIHRERDGGR